MPSASYVFLEPAPGPDDPLGMLGACHRRLDARLDMLGRVIEVYEAGDAERYDQAAGAIALVIRHLHGPGAQHHLDEELSLFPRLTRLDADVATRIERLEAEHDALDAAWKSFLPTLASLSAGDVPTPAELAALAPAVTAFATAYRAHIRDEDEALFPHARRLLDADALAAIGREMRDRRTPT